MHTYSLWICAYWDVYTSTVGDDVIGYPAWRNPYRGFFLFPNTLSYWIFVTVGRPRWIYIYRLFLSRTRSKKITICTSKILFTTNLKNDQIWNHFAKNRQFLSLFDPISCQITRFIHQILIIFFTFCSFSGTNCNYI